MLLFKNMNILFKYKFKRSGFIEYCFERTSFIVRSWISRAWDTVLVFVEKMTDIVVDIRDEQNDFSIKVVADLDDACSACPNKEQIICEASEDSNEHVLSMDNKVIQFLGLTPGTTYEKSQLVQLTAEKIKPNDLDDLCKGCSWLSYGVCKDGNFSVACKI